ncbi:hypothetical protein K2Z84_16505 [Candidatus Binatia bacterium]|nr:hypothetical protein [Candidatus Binatia bacterium]
MPPSAVETPAAIDAFAGREAPETELSLARVARRLNRLSAQRALYRCLSVALFAAAALAACAGFVSSGEFRIALGAAALVVVLVLVLSLRALRRRWADALTAARWVESRIPLEQRLLTLVSAPSANVGTRIWPELVADNRTQLGRWSGQRLGIATVPANVVVLLLAVITAWLFLVPWYDADGRGPLEIPGRPAPEQDASGADGGAGPAAAAAGQQAGYQPGTQGGDKNDAAQRQTMGAKGAGAVGALQNELAKNFERTLGGNAVLDGSSGKMGDGAEPQQKRGNVDESGLGKSNAEEGGKTPDEQLARREQDDGTGQAVGHENGGEGGAAKPRPGVGERGNPAEAKGQKQAKGGPQTGGRPMPGGDKPADGPLAIGNEDGRKSQAGGAGAGANKATTELLAKKPLTLDGGRQTARFSLTLGGSPGKAGSDGPKSMEAQPTSRIADAAGGPQEADRAVRHEEIPAEYEAVVKRIFKREP